MKKRVFSVIICLILLISFNANVVYADSVTGFINGSDDLLVLATITDISNDTIVIEPFSCLKNRITQTDTVLPDTISMNKFRYSYCPEHADNFNIAKIGDNIVISLVKNKNVYSIKNGVFKTDTVDVNNIRVLVPISVKGEECEAKLVALSYFLTSGGNSNNFIYQDGTVKVTENNAQITIYPSEKNTKKLITYVGEDGKEMATNDGDVITGGINLTLDDNEDAWIYAIITIAAGLLIGFALIVLLNKLIFRKRDAK